MPDKFLDVLPDPNYGVTDAGFPGGTLGQGFASIKLSEQKKEKKTRTLTGRIIHRASYKPLWGVGITYNPMTQTQFNPIYNFLMEKHGGAKPFFVSLPQYAAPKDSLFATHVLTATIQTNNAYNPGVSSIDLKNTAWSSNSYTTTGLPSLGDLFNISDSDNTFNKKTYMVTRVETYSNFLDGNPVTSGTIRVHFYPMLQNLTPVNAVVVFNNPLIQVVQQQDIQEYALNNSNLYSFSLKLKEALY